MFLDAGEKQQNPVLQTSCDKVQKMKPLFCVFESLAVMWPYGYLQGFQKVLSRHLRDNDVGGEV